MWRIWNAYCTLHSMAHYILKSLNWSLRFSIMNRLKMICIAKLLWKRCWWARMSLINITSKIIRHFIDGWDDFQFEIGISHKIYVGSFGRLIDVKGSMPKKRSDWFIEIKALNIPTEVSFRMQAGTQSNNQPSNEERINRLIGNISMKLVSML